MMIEFAKSLAESAALDGIKMTVREDYSGRGMNGTTTAAMVCDCWQDFAAAVALLVADKKGDLDSNDGTIHGQILGLRSDQMGRDTIIY